MMQEEYSLDSQQHRDTRSGTLSPLEFGNPHSAAYFSGSGPAPTIQAHVRAPSSTFVNPNDISRTTQELSGLYDESQCGPLLSPHSAVSASFQGTVSGPPTPIPSLSPVTLGPNGPGSSDYDQSPHSPYDEFTQQDPTRSAFAFPSTQPAYQEPSPHYRTRASRHKPQRSLSAGAIPRSLVHQAQVQQMQRSGSVQTPTPYDMKLEPAQIPVKGSSVGAGAFVYKVYNMLLDTDYQELIAFTAAGNTFVVSNATQFSKTVLPKHFKHNNFSSFVRQLNMYGFHKVNKTPRGQKGTAESQAWEFSHPKFMRGRVDLLEGIRRKTQDESLATSLSNVAARIDSSTASLPQSEPGSQLPKESSQPQRSSSRVKQEHPARRSMTFNQQEPQPQPLPAQQAEQFRSQQQQPTQPGHISLPAYLQMLHAHQSDLGIHVTRLEDTCHALYEMVTDGRRKEDALIYCITQLYDHIQQQSNDKLSFELPPFLFTSPPPLSHSPNDPRFAIPAFNMMDPAGQFAEAEQDYSMHMQVDSDMSNGRPRMTGLGVDAPQLNGFS